MNSDPQQMSEKISVPFPKTQSMTVKGDIKINLTVVAGIVRLAVQRVKGVHSVGGGFVEGIAEMFSKKDSERGVRVSENENGNYEIEVKVNLLFGSELVKVGEDIQQTIAESVQQMTRKQVERIDVIIDGVRTETSDAGTKDASS